MNENSKNVKLEKRKIASRKRGMLLLLKTAEKVHWNMMAFCRKMGADANGNRIDAA